MARYLLHHHHRAHECGIAFASFKGEDTPLRHTATFASCRSGGHDIWWLVDAGSRQAALAQLPHYVARRSTVTEIAEVQIP
jgi:hypothetical protein